MKKIKLHEDLGISGKNGIRTAHYGKNYKFLKEIKEEFLRKFLDGYNSLNLVSDEKHDLYYLCGVPERGGDREIIANSYEKLNIEDIINQEGMIMEKNLMHLIKKSPLYHDHFLHYKKKKY